MSIVYPLAMPAAPGFKALALMQNFIVARTNSPFSAQEQVYEHQGSWWSAKIDLPVMQRPAASKWIAFLAALNGRSGTFLLGDPAGTAPIGNAAGTVLVNGAGQSGLKTLSVRGLTGTLKAGDYFSVGTGTKQRLYMNLTDATGSPVTLDVFPRVRDTPLDGDAVTLLTAQGCFHLDSNTSLWSIDNALLYGISFTAVEAF